jgi:hypothetical protein
MGPCDDMGEEVQELKGEQDDGKRGKAMGPCDDMGEVQELKGEVHAPNARES